MVGGAQAKNRSVGGEAWRSRPSALLLGATLLVAAAALALPYFVPLASLFGFVALPAAVLAAIALIAAAYLVTTEAVKRGFFRSSRDSAAA